MCRFACVFALKNRLVIYREYVLVIRFIETIEIIDTSNRMNFIRNMSSEKYDYHVFRINKKLGDIVCSMEESKLAIETIKI